MRLTLLLLMAGLLTACFRQPSAPSIEVPSFKSGIIRIDDCSQSLSTVSNAISGYACYADAVFDFPRQRFNWRDLPIRHAAVEIRDNATDALIKSGWTTENGFFSFDTDGLKSGSSYRLRVLTRSEYLAANGEYSQVLGESLLAVAVYRDFVFNGAGDAFKIVAHTDVSGQYFNIFDQLINMQHFLRDRFAVTKPPRLYLLWYPGKSGVSTYYCASASGGVDASCPYSSFISVLGDRNDSDGYDDMVLLHEMGHYIMNHFSRDDSPGGPHGLTDRGQDIRLSWSEGVATALAGMIQEYVGVGSPDWYLDTAYESGLAYQEETVPVIVDYSMELPVYCPKCIPVGREDLRPYALGFANELAVSTVVWDLFDSSNNGEAQFDTLSEPERVISHLRALASKNVAVSFQDFYEAWKDDGVELDALHAIIEERRMYMQPDQFDDPDLAQNDDSRSGAAPYEVTALGAPYNNQQHNFHHRDDVDWVALDLNAGTNYAIAIKEQLSGVQVKADLFDSSGRFIKNTSSNTTGMEYQPASTATYYLKMSRDLTPFDPNAGLLRYGSYVLQVFEYPRLP